MNLLKNPLLVEPNLIYQKSFENYVLAYQSINDQHYFDKYKKALEDFPGYLHYIQADSYTSTFWLIDDQQVVGVVRIRHQSDPYAGHIGYDISPVHRNEGYGQFILKTALVKARQIGIKDITLTCSVDNVASRKIIERSGGVFIGTIHNDEDEDLNQFIIKD